MIWKNHKIFPEEKYRVDTEILLYRFGNAMLFSCKKCKNKVRSALNTLFFLCDIEKTLVIIVSDIIETDVFWSFPAL